MSEETNSTETTQAKTPKPMTLEEWRAVSYERYRVMMRLLRHIRIAAWIAAVGALGLMAYWWGLIPLRFAFWGEDLPL